jgi:hypothetical protein
MGLNNRKKSVESINIIYRRIAEMVLMLKQKELDSVRAGILNKLERVLAVVNNDASYREGINKLDMAGLRSYERNLNQLLNKMTMGNDRVRARLFSQYPEYSIGSREEPMFKPASSIRNISVKRVRDFPEFAWENYIERDLINEKYIGAIPYQRSIQIGIDYLIKIGDLFPTVNDATLSDIDQRENHDSLLSLKNKSVNINRSSVSILGANLSNIIDFVYSAFEKSNQLAPDGSKIGSIVLAYNKITINGNITTWTIRVTIRNMIENTPYYFSMLKSQARLFINRLKNSNNTKEKEAYENICNLFI